MNLVTLLLSFLWTLNFALSETRSTHEKIFGSDQMSAKQEVKVKIGKKSQVIELFSPRAQQTLITDKKRSIVLIENNSQLSELPDALVHKIKSQTQKSVENFYIMANFVHSDINDPSQNRFYIAIIPRSVNVTSIYYQVEWFGAGVGAHNQIRMKLSEPIKLIAQDSEDEPVYTLDNADIVYSLQAARAEDGEQNWDVFKGVMGEYANALQFFSATSKARLQIERSFVENYEILNLSAEQKRAVFKKALLTSNEEQETGIYNTVFNSCVTHALSALQGGLNSIDTQHFNPYTVIEMIKKNKDGVKLKKTKSFNEEFSALIDDGEIMTMEMIQNQESYKKFKLVEDLVMKAEFDEFIKNITYFIIENKITFDDVKSLVSDLKKGKTLDQVKTNKVAQAFAEYAQKQWYELLTDEDLKSFLISLEAMASQEI